MAGDGVKGRGMGLCIWGVGVSGEGYSVWYNGSSNGAFYGGVGDGRDNPDEIGQEVCERGVERKDTRPDLRGDWEARVKSNRKGGEDF